VGTHDFVSFQTSGSMRLTTERTVYEVTVERREAELTDRVVIEVEADGFLYNMVRNFVGTLVEVGKGKQPIGWPAEVLAVRDRRRAGMTAPPHGLYLVSVEYPPMSDCGMRFADRGLKRPKNSRWSRIVLIGNPKSAIRNSSDAHRPLDHPHDRRRRRRIRSSTARI
jgi:tRNA pseudouridine38-40 synthase